MIAISFSKSRGRPSRPFDGPVHSEYFNRSLISKLVIYIYKSVTNESIINIMINILTY